MDGATSWQKFRFITWPSMRTLYLTCTILSMIWTLGDFNSVYLLTGGGPADLTHVLATLGIRYLRLDQVDLSMAAIVVALPGGAAARLLHDEAAVEMSPHARRNALLAAPRGGAVSPSGRPFGTDETSPHARRNALLAAPRGGAVSPSGRPFGTT